MNGDEFLSLIPYLISLTLSVGISVYTWQRRAKSAGAGAFALVALCQAEWTLGFIFEIMSDDLATKIFWDSAQFIGVFGWVAAFVVFVLAYAGHEWVKAPGVLRGLIGITIALSIIALTNSWHGLLYETATVEPGEVFSVLTYEFSLTFWIMSSYGYLLFFAGIFILFRTMLQPHRLYRAQTSLVLVGMFIPFAATLLSLFEVQLSGQRDITPLVFGLSNLLVVLGLFRYRLFDIIPVARSTIVEIMQDAVLVFDAKDRLIDFNAAARKLASLDTGHIIGQATSRLFAEWVILLQQYESHQSVHTEIDIAIDDEKCYFDCNISPIWGRGGKVTGRVVVLRDITDRKNESKELARHRDQLEQMVEERTVELTTANRQLQNEVTARERAEIALRLQHDYMSQIVNRSPTIICGIRSDGTTTFMNPAGEKITGYTANEIAGSHWWKTFYPDDDYQQVEKLFNDSTNGGTGGGTGGGVSDYPMTLTTKNGEKRTILWTSFNRKDNHDTLIEVIGFGHDMTENKKTEAALREKERILTEAQRVAHVGNWVNYLDRGELYWSDEMFRIFGRERQPIDRELIVSWVHPDDRDLLNKAVDQRFEGKGIMDVEYRFIHPQDGSIRHVHSRGEILFNQKGYPIKSVGTIQDITERKKAEAALRHYAERLQVLHDIDAAILKSVLPEETATATLRQIRQFIPCQYAGISLFDFETNERVIFATDYSGDPIMHIGARYPLDPEWKNTFKEKKAIIFKDIQALESIPDSIKKTKENGFHCAATIRLLAQEKLIGSLTLLSKETGVFTDEQLAIATEVSDQLAIAIQHAQLSEDNRRRVDELDTLRRITLDITAQLDLDNLLNALVERAITLLNASIGGLFLYKPEEHILELFVAKGGNSPALIGETVQRGQGLAGKTWEMGKTLIISDYSAWQSSLDVFNEAPLTASMGVPIHWGEKFLGVINLSITTDSQRKFSTQDTQLLELFANQAAVAIQNARLYEQVQQHAADLEKRVAERTAALESANQRLQELSQAKDKFVSNVSHELRTPLTNLNLNIYMMHRKPTEYATYLAAFERETKRLENMIESLLQLSRMDQDRVDFFFTSIDLNAMIGSQTKDRLLLAESKSLDLQFTPQDPLPMVAADSNLLGQVLSIFLTNAFNYTPSGGEIMVSTKVKQMDDQTWVGFSVSDTGPGITEEDQKQLFERFFRGTAGRTSGAAGTGLGLAIAVEIMQRHKGYIEAESSGVPGEGATFSAWLLVN